MRFGSDNRLRRTLDVFILLVPVEVMAGTVVIHEGD
jgi:hypothetical protein